MHAAPREQEVVLRFGGLPFASHCFSRFSLGLRNYRNPMASATQHPLYRAHAERWMQSLAMQDVTRIDFALDPEHVYERVFAQAGGQRGGLDLLTVTRSKRLAILELKASENPGLPLMRQ